MKKKEIIDLINDERFSIALQYWFELHTHQQGKNVDIDILYKILSQGILKGQYRGIAAVIEDENNLKTVRNLVLEENKITAELANEVGKLARKIRLPAIADEFYSISSLIYQKLGDKYNFLKLSINQANLQLNYGNFASALDKYEDLLSKVTEHKDLEALTLMNNGSCIYQMGEIEKALQLFEKSLKLYIEIGDKIRVGHNYLNIGVVHLNQLNSELATLNFDKAYQTYFDHGYGRGQIIAKEQKIRTLLVAKHHEKAIHEAKQLFDIIDMHQDYRTYARIAYLVVDLLSPLEITELFSSFISVIPKVNDPQEVFKLLHKIINAQIITGNFDPSTGVRLEQLYEISEQLNDEGSGYDILLQQLWYQFYNNNISIAEEIISKLKSMNSSLYLTEISIYYILTSQFNLAYNEIKKLKPLRERWIDQHSIRIGFLYLLITLQLNKIVEVRKCFKHIEEAKILPDNTFFALGLNFLGIKNEFQIPELSGIQIEKINSVIEKKPYLKSRCWDLDETGIVIDKTNNIADCPKILRIVIDNI